MRAVRTVVLTLLVLILAPTQAHADRRLDRALVVANDVWHAPCGGRTAVAFDQLPEGVTAQVQGRRPCTIVFDPEDYAELDYLWVCTYVEHEMGHVAGFIDPKNPSDMSHSHNDDSIMAALFIQDERRCGHDSLPYLATIGAARPTAAAALVSIRRARVAFRHRRLRTERAEFRALRRAR